MEKSFRSAMFGFNKEDVAKFIYQQNKSFEKKMAEKDAELEKASIALADALKQEETWREHREKVSEVLKLADALESRSSAFDEALTTEQEDLSSLEESFRSISEKCERLEAFREKAQKFDSLATALSGIFGGIAQEADQPTDDTSEEDDSAAIHLALVHAEEKRAVARELKEVCDQMIALLQELKN